MARTKQTFRRSDLDKTTVVLDKKTTVNKAQCQSTTKAGSQCSRNAVAGEKFCTQHLKQQSIQTVAKPIKLKIKIQSLSGKESQMISDKTLTDSIEYFVTYYGGGNISDEDDEGFASGDITKIDEISKRIVKLSVEQFKELLTNIIEEQLKQKIISTSDEFLFETDERSELARLAIKKKYVTEDDIYARLK